MHVVRVPLLNANEDELNVVGVFVAEGEEVKAGQLVLALESTKAATDIEAPAAGFVRRISVAEGDRVSVGAILVVITETADESLEGLEVSERSASDEVRATKRARELAAAHDIDLASLGVDGIVKERDVRAALELKPAAAAAPLGALVEGPLPTIILGAGGHARVIVDVARVSRPDLTLAGVVDDAVPAPSDVLGVPVVGSSAHLAEARERGVRHALLGVGAVTNNALRKTLYEKLRAHDLAVPALVHPKAAVERSATVGAGCQIFAGAVVGSAADLGENVIVNSGVVVSHDCRIGAHVHLTPGAILAGGVTIGEGSVIGMGVTVYLGVSIGAGVTITNGVHVFHDVPDGAVVRGSS